jgi:flagella basal body P-ring formation protein FlgA
MTFFSKSLLFLFALSQAHGVAAQERPDARQGHAALRQTVEQFLHTQAGGLPGTIRVTVGSIDPRLSLAACPAPEAFLPSGGRAWGKTTVGVRCIAPSPWTIYISATVRVQGEYIVTAVPLAQGRSIGPNDIVKVAGDLTALPAGIITDPAQAVGRSLAISVPLGTPLRQDVLRGQRVVKQGQMVRVVSEGPGFKVSSEARALNNATDGQLAQARTASGEVISGIARMGGIVEVNY